MNLRLNLISCFVGTTILVGSANGQVTKKGSGYLLRVKYTAGKVARFASTTSISMGKGVKPMNLSLPFTIKVLSVKGDASTLLVTPGEAVMEGKRAGKLMTPVKVVLNNRNEAVGGTQSSNVGAQYPAKPVKVGDVWKSKMPVALGGKPVVTTTTYKFLGLKKVGRTRTATIAMTIGGPAEGTGLVSLNPADGQMLSMKLSLKVSTAETGQVSMTTYMHRQ